MPPTAPFACPHCGNTQYHRHVGLFHVSADRLIRYLYQGSKAKLFVPGAVLPDDAVVIGAFWSDCSEALVVRVEHATFHPVYEGWEWPTIGGLRLGDQISEATPLLLRTWAARLEAEDAAEQEAEMAQP